ncbi:hypothetical protein PILCRDRAFT_498339 [Piloderma croceum F 1598]|uniref:Uncharacterized protein n=1 Tax=Piloderma croceum (strain F 1598) TaxID=765440 RepID=A0A0C3FAK9_PILCF|nr:hypothetical protein PILCRDRAFT_498339 [Piloderma croceum F 1598]
MTKQSRVGIEGMALNNRHGEEQMCPFIQECTMPVGNICQILLSLILMLLALNRVYVPPRRSTSPSVTDMALSRSPGVPLNTPGHCYPPHPQLID